LIDLVRYFALLRRYSYTRKHRYRYSYTQKEKEKTSEELLFYVQQKENQFGLTLSSHQAPMVIFIFFSNTSFAVKLKANQM